MAEPRRSGAAAAAASANVELMRDAAEFSRQLLSAVAYADACRDTIVDVLLNRTRRFTRLSRPRSRHFNSQVLSAIVRARDLAADFELFASSTSLDDLPRKTVAGWARRADDVAHYARVVTRASFAKWNRSGGSPTFAYRWFVVFDRPSRLSHLSARQRLLATLRDPSG